MIYAVLKNTKKISTSFAFRTKIQSKVENGMIVLGHSTRNYYLTTKKPDSGLIIKIKMLDKDCFHFSVKL